MGIFNWFARKKRRSKNRATGEQKAFEFRHIMVFRQGPVPPHGTPCTQAEAVEAIKALVQSPDASPAIKQEPTAVEGPARPPLEEFASAILDDGKTPCSMIFGGIDDRNDMNIFLYARDKGPETNYIHLYNSHFGANDYKVCLFFERTIPVGRVIDRPQSADQVNAVIFKIGSSTFPEEELASIIPRFLQSASFDDVPAIVRWREGNLQMVLKTGCLPFIKGLSLVAFGGGDYGQKFLVDLGSFNITDPAQRAVFEKIMREHLNSPSGSLELLQATVDGSLYVLTMAMED